MEPIKIFISYAKEDIEKINPLYLALKKAGYEPWLDRANLSPGTDWKYEITTAMETSAFFLACLSKNSIDKTGFVQKELKMALDIMDLQPEGRIYLLPVRLEECDVPFKLRHLHWCDIFDNHGLEHLLRAIDRAAVERGFVWFTAKALAGPDKGKEFKIPLSSFTIGRTESNGIRLTDIKVSTLHAKIESRNNKVVFNHLSDKNPSVITGEKGAVKLEADNKKKTLLKDGDIITLGDTQLKISIRRTTVKQVITTEVV
jgi:hypothetical protein